MNVRGHFFCDFCDDVVNVRPAGEPLVKCPVCHHLTAHWVPDTLRQRQRVMARQEELMPLPTATERAALAAHWFAEMRRALA